MTVNNAKSLKHNELDYVCKQFVVCLNAEQRKIKLFSESKQTKIDSFIAGVVHTTKLHTLLTEERMNSLVESIFNDSDITEFMLCLTDQFVFFTHSNDFEDRHLAYNIANQLWQKPTQSHPTGYTPARIQSSLATRYNYEQTVENLLENKWIMTFVMLYMFGQTNNTQ